MNESSAIAAPVMTFYSRSFYKDVAMNRKGLGFLYLFLLFWLCWTLICVRNYTIVDGVFRSKEGVALINQIPGMSWTNGKLSIDKDSPYSISQEGQPFIVFDTSGKMKSLSDAAPAHFLLTQDGCIFEDKAEGEEKSLHWKQFMTADYNVGSGMIKDFLSKLPFWLAVGQWFLGIFFWVGHMLAALILGAIGLIMDRKNLGYATAVRLSSFAMTPCIILSTIRDLIPVHIPFWTRNCASTTILVLFLYFAYSSVNQEANE